MSAEITLTPRQQIIDVLSGDLNAQGWSQPNKLWFIKGEAGDEWLEFVETFTGAPENRMIKLIADGDPADDVQGVVVATEGWTYPASLMATFKSEQALRAFWRLSPPSDHPQRVELRQVLFVHKDGEVINLVVHNENEQPKTWAQLDSSNPCPTGDRTIDAARAYLGSYQAIVDRVRTQSGFEPIQKMAGVIQKMLSGALNTDEATLGIFNSMPEEIKIEMVKTMPSKLKDTLRNLLSPEERQKYGL